MTTQLLTRRPVFRSLRTAETPRQPESRHADSRQLESRQAESRKPARPQRLDAGRMQEVEDRLLAGAFERQPNRDRAVAHLLSDVERHVAAEPVGRTMPTRDISRAQRMEDLLLQAIVRTHPNRDLAIERLLGDVVGDAAMDDGDDEADRALFDMSVDNDFDGLG